jgi:hypothetical protein
MRDIDTLRGAALVLTSVATLAVAETTGSRTARRIHDRIERKITDITEDTA